MGRERELTPSLTALWNVRTSNMHSEKVEKKIHFIVNLKKILAYAYVTQVIITGVHWGSV